MPVARPWARGRHRLSVGPSSTQIRDSTRFFGMAFFCSAFATAEFRTLTSVWFDPSGENARIRRASSTWRPRIRSTLRRSLRGEIRRYLAVAFASMFVTPSLEGGAPLRVVAMRPERPGDGELTQLVPDHGLRDEHGHVLAPVVDGDGVSHHLRHHRGATRPRPDDALVAAPVHLDHLLHQVVIHERSLLDRPRHELAPPLPTTPDDELVRGLGLAGPPFLLAPR